MKKTLLLFTLATATLTAYGQCVDCNQNDYKKNSIGLDLVPIVQNMVHSDSLIPYGIIYRRFLTSRLAVRARLDVGYKSSSQPEVSELTFGYNTIHTKRQSIGIGLGYEYVLPLRSWVDFNCGLSVAYRWSKTSSREKGTAYVSGTTLDDIVYMLIEDYKEQPLSKQYFVQPFVGLTIHINKQVSILSEFSPYYSYTYLHNKREKTEKSNNGGLYIHWWSRRYTLHEINAQCSISLLFNF